MRTDNGKQLEAREYWRLLRAVVELGESIGINLARNGLSGSFQLLAVDIDQYPETRALKEFSSEQAIFDWLFIGAERAFNRKRGALYHAELENRT